MIIQNPEEYQLLELKKLWKEAFLDTDEAIDMFFNSAFSKKRCLCVVENKTVIASLFWFDCSFSDKKIAYVYAVSTLKEYRGQGICNSLMQYLHNELKTLGYSGAILVPSSQKLFEFYGKMGYKTASFVDEFSADLNSCNEGELVEINAKEFEKLRREFLPENSVVQEGENLLFLKEFARFYKGIDFLAVVINEGDALFVAELLGNLENAKKTLGILGYDKCKIRMPGKAKPFSMFYSFETDNEVMPKYFGLAFD